MIPPAWSQPDARAIIEPESAPFRLLLRDLQPFLSPDALHSLVIYGPSCVLQHSVHTAVAKSTEFTCEVDDG